MSSLIESLCTDSHKSQSKLINGRKEKILVKELPKFQNKETKEKNNNSNNLQNVGETKIYSKAIMKIREKLSKITENNTKVNKDKVVKTNSEMKIIENKIINRNNSNKSVTNQVVQKEKFNEVRKNFKSVKAEEKNDKIDSFVNELRTLRFEELMDQDNIKKYSDLFSDNNSKVEKIDKFKKSSNHLNFKRKRPQENSIDSSPKRKIRHEIKIGEKSKMNTEKSVKTSSNYQIKSSSSSSEKVIIDNEHKSKTENKVTNKIENRDINSTKIEKIKKNDKINETKLIKKDSNLIQNNFLKQDKNSSINKSNTSFIKNSVNKSNDLKSDTNKANKLENLNITNKTSTSSQRLNINKKLDEKKPTHFSEETSIKKIKTKAEVLNINEPKINKLENKNSISNVILSKPINHDVKNNKISKPLIDYDKRIEKKPLPKKKYDKRFAIFEEGDDLQDFICDDEESPNWQVEMAKIKKTLHRNSGRRQYNDNDDDIMEAQFSEIEQEEVNAMKIAEKEDEMEELRERLFYCKKKKSN